MSTRVSPFVVQPSSDSSRMHRNTPRVTCLLCRVLYPTTLQHRHLLPDSASEAKTIVLTPTRYPNGQQTPMGVLTIRAA